MLNACDTETIYAIRALRDVVSERSRPLVLWIGAGASRWCGYPSWEDLADTLHSRFLKTEKQYEREQAIRYLSAKDFPAVFQLCKQSNRKLYNQLLANSFGPARKTPVYERFLDLLKLISPLQVVTTNVDEALEKNLPETVTVQRTDIERVSDLIQAQKPFVCKVHGTISSIEGTVFAADDYKTLLETRPFLDLIQFLFSNSCIVFLGYGLRDDYLIKGLEAASLARPLFGTGPHFAVLPTRDERLPDSIRTITYQTEQRGDHRSSLVVLDILARARSVPRVATPLPEKHTDSTPDISSAYYIADFTPPGIWQSSYNLQAVGASGQGLDITIGTGFVDSELTFRSSTAMHDLTVGLICFDYVCLPLLDLGKVHQLLGSEKFWELIRERALRFVYCPSSVAVLYPNKATMSGGDIGMMKLVGDGTAPLSVPQVIRKQLGVVPGKESEADDLFKRLEALVTVLDEALSAPLPELVRGTLIQPSVQKALGISEDFLPTKVPRWNVFPVLRLGHLVSVGRICQELHIQAARIGFGGETLVSAAFSVAAADDWAEEAAGYVLGARCDTDLGELVFNDPTILTAILKFRETQEGIDLRGRIREILSTNEGNEFIASVNAGLKRNIPLRMLEQARNQLSGLLVAQKNKYPLTSAVWNTIPNSDVALFLWKKRSLEILERYCNENRIGPYDQCPCRSGAKLRFCCLAALKS
jgi:hypothetical protein